MIQLSIHTDKFIKALCWMLVHSLWQGLLLALVAGIIVLGTKRAGAAVRYNLLTGVLLLFIAGIVVTFIWQLSGVYSNEDQFTIQLLNLRNEQGLGFLENNASVKEPVYFIQSLESFFNTNSALIVFGWILLLGLKSIRLIGGLYAIHRIKRKDVSSPGVYWIGKINELSLQLGIRKKVQFLQSGIAKVPMVIGHLKPLILFPVGILAALPPAEIEAILVHELAHIRRRDYLVNLLQNLLEVFFFFNPAVIWVSSLMRTERENCCDDIAIANAGNKKNYIQALLSFQEYNLGFPPCAPALTNRKYHLLQRVKRIIYNNNKTLNAMEKSFLTAGLVVIGCSLVAFSSGESNAQGNKTTRTVQEAIFARASFPHSTVSNNQNFSVQGGSSAVQNEPDTVPVSRKRKENINGTIVSDVGGKHYEIVLENNIITQLLIDGQKIPKEKIPDYSDLTDRIITEAIVAAEKAKEEAERSRKQAEDSKEMAESSRVQANESRKQAELANMQVEKSRQLSQELKLQSGKSRELSERALLAESAMKEREISMGLARENLKQAEISREHALQLRIEAEKSRQVSQEIILEAGKSRELSERAMKEHEISMGLARENLKQAEISREHVAQARIEAEKSMQLAGEARNLAEESRKTAELSRAEAEKIRKAIIQDLIKEKVISDGKGLHSLTLNDEELIVNGVRQPEALHKKFKEKYAKEKGTRFNYYD